jgi:hypothetical protein
LKSNYSTKKGGVARVCDILSGQELLQKMIQRFDCAESILSKLSISLAAHFGPRAVVLAAYPLN